MSELTLVTEVAWGMLGNDEPGEAIKQTIETEKRHVATMLCYIGFQITSQVFEHDSEGGRLITRATAVGPGTHYYSGAKYGDFRKPRIIEPGQKRYLDITGLKPEQTS